MQDLYAPPSCEDMKLRDDDRNWLKQEISDQVTAAIGTVIDSLKPHGARRIGRWLQEWGLVAVAVATPLTLLGLLITVSIFAASGLTKNAEFRTRTEDRLNTIEKDIGSIRDTLKQLSPLLRDVTIKRIQEAGNLTPKQLSAQLPDLKNLARTAKSENVPIKPEIVETVGKKLIEAGGADAWNTALDFLNYKSFLNASLSLPLSPSVLNSGTFTTTYSHNSPTGTASPRLSVVGLVPREQAAQFAIMGEPDPNSSLTVGNDWIFVDGGNLILDNMQLKKVILRNVHIVYEGGSLTMQDVYFINCTFDVRQQSNGQRLVMAVLEPSPAVSFKAV